MAVDNSSRIRQTFGIIITAVAIAPLALQAQTPTLEEMWQIIQRQQETIDELRSRLADTDTRLQQNEQAVELTADAVETVRESESVSADSTAVGGYGELHYNNLDDGALADGDDSLNRVDFHRFVLYFGHEFTDNIRFFSEFELEHSLAGEGAPGEVELEQAWVELDLNVSHRFRAGLDILPVGILNPTHEPNTFYGVERNRIESEIIPSTWWEAGAGFNGELAPGWNYDFVIHSGLAVPTDGSSTFRPRSGRLKVAEADDLDVASTGRIRYTGVPGLELGVSGQYQADITGTDDEFDISATLLEGHAIWQHAGGFGLRALYARWDMGDDTGLNPAAFNADNLSGWYVEPSYRFGQRRGISGEFGVFARYSAWDERNRLGAAHRYEEFSQITAGVNWWPHPSVVFKFDAQWEDADGEVDRLLDGFNVGLGYQF